MAFWIGVVVMSEDKKPPVPELPPLAGEERALVAKYPMPKGVPDAEVNKNLLGAALDVSTTTIDKWLVLPEAERIPFVERGTNGRSYVFRLSVAYAWRMARDAQEAATRQHAEDATAQLRMEFLGGSIQDLSRAALSPKEQEQGRHPPQDEREQPLDVLRREAQINIER